MKGVVKKSLPSGGWHRVVLENGREVRVRRSALTASETGRGDEEGERGEEGDETRTRTTRMTTTTTTIKITWPLELDDRRAFPETDLRARRRRRR